MLPIRALGSSFDNNRSLTREATMEIIVADRRTIEAVSESLWETLRKAAETRPVVPAPAKADR